MVITEATPRIALNAQLLSLRSSYRNAGISWYIRNLLEQYDRLEGDNPFTAYVADPEYHAKKLRVCCRRPAGQNPILRILWEQSILPLHLASSRAQLLHAMAFVAPLFCPCPAVATIYDLSFLRFPQAFRPLNRRYLAAFTALTARKARHLIAISESTRQDVIELLHVPPERVSTIYCGVDNHYLPLPTQEIEEFKRQKGLPEGFILFLGTLEPRKNITGLLQAYAHWRRSDPRIPLLFVAGAKGWYYQEVFAEVMRLGLEHSVIFPGYIPSQELPLWYNAAKIFVYPSLYEGFGLPVLEAMACGTPVITSRASSLPEVAGDAAVLVDPLQREELAAAMEDLWYNEEEWQRYADAGQRRARQFKWELTARQTLAIYREALAA